MISSKEVLISKCEDYLESNQSEASKHAQQPRNLEMKCFVGTG